MDKEKMVWVQNNHTSSVTVKVEDEKTGEVKIEKTFPVYLADRMTGRMVHSGYTKLSESEYNACAAGSKLFRSFVDKGMLIKYDEPPEDATTPAEQIIMLRGKIRALEGELAAKSVEINDLKTAGTTADVESEELVIAQARVVELEGALEEANKKASDPDGAFASLEKQLADEKAENEKLKKALEKLNKKNGK